jgi:hypothetical protein
MKKMTFDELVRSVHPDVPWVNLAKKCLMSQRGFWNLRYGRVTPRPTTLRVLSERLRIPAEELLAAIKQSARTS